MSAAGRTGSEDERAAPWADAAAALNLFAVDPAGTGIALRARIGPGRDRFLSLLREVCPDRPLRRVPLNVSDGRLFGGLDLAATLTAGRPVAERGILAEADGGLVLLPMAERIAVSAAARLLAVIDTGEVRLERDGLARITPARFGIVALDEGAETDERPPAALLDRLAFLVDLDAVTARDAPPALATPDEIAAAQARLPAVEADDAAVQALCATALALGVASLRASLLALNAARIAAALAGRDRVLDEDAVLAARLVLAPRATVLPAAEGAEEEPAPEPPDAEPPADDEADRGEDLPGNLDEVVLEAALAAIPPGLLAQLKAAGAAGRGQRSGRVGAFRNGGTRGRPAGLRRGAPRSGARLNVVETLRAAAPWQGLRRDEARRRGRAADRVEVRPDDFRVTRLKQRAQTTTIFVVDASGSSAFQRLAEAKGAVELLLAEAYVRRDQVALLSFRGRGAELLLPPTRSLVRAKRSLASLPGGGGTPLAAGLEAGAALADAVRRRGETPVLILLSDGRANVALDGIARRVEAGEQATAAARRLREGGFTCLFVDTAPRPDPAAGRLAQAMDALYVPLPRADAQSLSRAVKAVAPAGRGR